MGAVKDPVEVTGVIPGRVYNVPTYTNLFGKIEDYGPLSLKIYSRETKSGNFGVKPISLITALTLYYKDNVDNLTDEEIRVAALMIKSLSLLKEKERNEK